VTKIKIFGGDRMDFLEELYHNGIFPSEDNIRPNYIEYRELEEKAERLRNQLQDILNNEQKYVLQQLLETKLNIQSFDMATCFANGCRLGGRLVAEIYK
jgi:hypothetical protein